MSSSSVSHVETVEGKRILCTADVRGNISELNRLAHELNADYIIHTGDFGFYDRSSLERMGERPLKHWIQYSTFISAQQRQRLLYNSSSFEHMCRMIEQSPTTLLSEFPDYLEGIKQLSVPVYTVWGACEDVAILEKFRQGEYHIHNLYILDEASTHVLEVEGVSLRLFGLGGAVVQHKLFDNGEGMDTIAGGLGMMWTTALQIGELVELAESVYDPTETRMLVTHASPGREGLLAQLALTLQADFTISAGLHFRYNIAYNEFACQPDQDHFRQRLLQSQQQFMQLWDTIKDTVEESVDDRQYTLLRHALNVVNRIPPPSPVTAAEIDVAQENLDTKFWERDEMAFKNMWNFNLPDAAYGSLVFNISQGIMSSEIKSYGLNFTYRKQQQQKQQQQDEQQKQDMSNQYQRKRQSMNMMQQHQRNLFTLYVGGLSNTTLEEEDIRAYFGYENVAGVKFPVDPSTQLPKAHCYVEFTSQQALEQALTKNGSIFKDNRLIINRPNTQYSDIRRSSSNNSFRRGRMSYQHGQRDSRTLYN
ncbi:hypothetical protein BDF20DRAFT_829154 [Mycotypha africana]|uniref:uncharacterized protein n=1 Tax=Mycotypha africana TaxID=64632 RepID=UPI0023004F78|nr:uncharacterized protein BDF20DRAFT_829154 [Mycotypha africana]KAI8967753.1 hypothetical protein BDF20DRAFT_829154 [Mycotypha africana]